VEYAIDEASNTVRQVWQYGQERGSDLYSPLYGNVQDLPVTHNRLMAAGNVQAAAGFLARTVELTYPDNTVVFEAAVQFRSSGSTGTHPGQYDYAGQTIRISLYPNEPFSWPVIGLIPARISPAPSGLGLRRPGIRL
jgi:arylsulfate sulfotransferase